MWGSRGDCKIEKEVNLRDITLEQAEAVSVRVNSDPEAAKRGFHNRRKRFPVLTSVMNTLADTFGSTDEQGTFLCGFVTALELLEEANPPLGIGLPDMPEVKP